MITSVKILKFISFAFIFLGIAMADRDWKILDESAILFKGKRYKPIDENGVFYYSYKVRFKNPMPHPNRKLEDILDANGFHGIVRCQLTDYIDCSKKEHSFVDDGKSRLWEYKGKKFRLTAPHGELSWFSYFFNTSGKAGETHLLVAELLNDRERYTTISLSVPQDEPWAPPYQEVKRIPGIKETQEPDGFHPDVGCGVYTGREYPLDGRTFNHIFPFFPKSKRIKLTISHLPKEREKDKANGAAVSRIWVFRVQDELPSARAEEVELREYPRRRIGIYQTHPWYFYGHYGHPPWTLQQRTKSLETLTDYLLFCGFNLVEFNAVNGSDRTGCAWYDSKYFDPLIGNLLKELFPIARKKGIYLLPVVTSLRPPEIDVSAQLVGKKGKYGFSRESCQIDRDGKTLTRAFGSPVPDPLRPETQQLLLSIFREILQRCRTQSNLLGVGFRVNGKIGLCYIGEADKCGRDTGYSEWDLSEFQKDTGVRISLKAGQTAFEWLRKNAWDEWMDWRCRRTRDFWLRARDLVLSYRKDLKLWVNTDLPCECPGTTIEWAEGIPFGELLRHHGYDPFLFKEDKGIIIQRVMMVGADRFFGAWGPPWGSHAEGYKLYHYQEELPRAYQTPDGSAVELYHNYWEEAPHPDYEFGLMRTATVTPPGRHYFEAASFSLRYGNVDTLAFMGWEGGSIGHETELRQWCRAFRALPAVEPRDFEGEISPECPDIWVKWFGPRLAVLNDSGERKEISLKFPPSKAFDSIIDLSTDLELPLRKAGKRISTTLSLQEYDLRALEMRRE